MKNQTIQYFFLGLAIAFSISVIVITSVITVFADPATIPVSFIWQLLVLCALCSVINLVYRSENIKFIWQSILGYILTTAAIITCGLVFGWYSFGENHLNRTYFVLTSFLVYSILYLVTWTIIWKITKVKKLELNKKLNEYKQNH